MKFPFNGLPRVVRERLVRLTTTKTGDPLLLFSDPSWNMGWFKYFLLIAAMGVMGFCLDFLLGRLRAGVHPRHDEEVFFSLAAATFFFLVAGLAIVYRFVWKPPPYREGLYVFPSGLMRVSGGDIDFTPVTTLGRPTLVTVRRNGSYSHSRLEFGGPFTFTFYSNAAAEEAVGKVLNAKQHMAALIAAKAEEPIRALDPFAECSLSGTWTMPANPHIPVEGPLATPTPGVATAVQVVGSLVLGVAVSAAAYGVLSWLHTR